MDKQFDESNYMFNSTPKDVYKNAKLFETFSQYGTVFELKEDENEKTVFSSKEEFFSKIQINSTEYKLLLAACFEVVNNNKELLIIIDINSEEINKYIFGFLVFLNRGLPIDISKTLGYTVMDNKLRISKIDNAENNNKKSKSKDGKEDILFNFATRKITFPETKLGSHIFLDFAWNNLNNSEMLKNFKSMAEILNENKLTINEYDEIVNIFRINENRYKLDETQRIQCLMEFYRQIDTSAQFSKRQYYSKLFYNMFEAEVEKKKLIRRRYLPSEAVIQMIINYSGLVDTYFKEETGEKIKKKINVYIILILIDGKDEGKLSYVSKVFLMVHDNKVMFRNLIDNLFINQKFVDEILKWYILMRLAEADNLNKLLNEVNFWGEVSARVIAMDFFARHIESNVLNIIMASEDKVALCIKVYNYFDCFKSSYITEEDRKIYAEYSRKIKNSIYSYMFEIIDLSKIKMDELLNIKLQNNSIYEEKEKVIQYTQHLLKGDNSLDIREFEKEICKLSQDVAFNIQNIIKEYYSGNIDNCNFKRIMTGFVEGAVYVNDIILYNFNGLIEYLYNNGGTDTCRNFIVWAADEYKELENTLVFNRFKSTMISYFRTYDEKAFSEKSANNIFRSIKNEKVKKLLKEIKRHMPGSFKRIIGKMTNTYK